MSLIPVDDEAFRRRALSAEAEARVKAEAARALSSGGHHGRGDPWRDDDLEFWQTEAHEAKRNLDAANRMIAAIRLGHVDRYDPDARNADAEDDRDRDTAHDAAAQVPRGMAS